MEAALERLIGLYQAERAGEESAAAFFQRLDAEFGRIDFLGNVAGDAVLVKASRGVELDLLVDRLRKELS